MMTLKDLIERERVKAAQKYAERLAWEATPEGTAWVAERAEYDRRMMAADMAFAAANPPDPFEEGADACLAGDEREPPDVLSKEDQNAWLAGYDSEVDSEEDHL